MTIAAIDPGSSESAYVTWDGERILEFAKQSNEALINRVLILRYNIDHLVIEQIRGYGLKVGNETFDTCIWSGRFCQCFGADRTTWMPRKTIAQHLCNTSTAGDRFIRQALCDRWGGEKAAVGTKQAPGPLRGITGDLWSALAAAVTFGERPLGLTPAR